MSGAFSAGGLISGLNTNEIIQQLMQLERQPIIRMERRIARLEEQRTAVGAVRTQLQTLHNRARDFGLETVFGQFRTTSSTESVVTASLSGANPSAGTYAVEVFQLASATIARGSGALGAAIDPTAPLTSSGITTAITGGDFTVNGVTFSVDPDTQSLNDILSEINSSGAGVTATYDPVTDKVAFENETPGDTSIINFGATGDTSNFLTAVGVRNAQQLTGENGSTVVTSSRNLGAINPAETLGLTNFRNGAVTAGSFRINGVQINVDPTANSLQDVLGAVNASDANVTASYDSITDTIRVVSNVLGSRTISLASGTSNFLEVVNLTTAEQTAGNDAEFSVDGGPVQTRNTNEIADVIAGVTLNLRSLGTSTVSVESDNEAVLEGIRGFITALNDALAEIRSQTARDGRLENDMSLTMISSQLQYLMFSNVEDLGGIFNNLAQIGISTGSTFDASAGTRFELNEEAFLDALRDNPQNVTQLFTNAGKTGIADLLEEYLRDATASTGFLNQRIRTSGTIDSQIQAYNDRIERMEHNLIRREQRYRAEFARLEQMMSAYQSQNTALLGLQSGLQGF